MNAAPQASLVIPALNPGRALLDLVSALERLGFRNIVVVDDGSAPAHLEIFEALLEMPGVELVRHERNLGKGSALKSGIRHVRDRHPQRPALVTVDADGQHLPDDIAEVARVLESGFDGSSLVLGVRAFDCAVPWRSRLGNGLTRLLFRLYTGKSLSDTQTGLRGMAADHADELLDIPLARYDFELEALIHAARTRRIVQVPIRTVYRDGNAASHFRPVVDSIRVYLVFVRQSVTFVRFSAVGVLSFALDLLLFWLALRAGFSIPGAVVAARLGSGAFNFAGNKLGVFGSLGWRQLPRELAGYLGLFAAVMALSAAGTSIAVEALGAPALPAKIGVDSLLFIAAFFAQRRWIFRRPGPFHSGR